MLSPSPSPVPMAFKMSIKTSSINSNWISQLSTHCAHIQYSNIVKFQIDIIKKSLMNAADSPPLEQDIWSCLALHDLYNC